MITYNIDPNTMTTRAILTVKNIHINGKWYDKKSYIGIAKWNPVDEYNEETGMNLAKARACRLFYKDLLKDYQKRYNELTKFQQKLKSKIESLSNKLLDVNDQIGMIADPPIIWIQTSSLAPLQYDVYLYGKRAFCVHLRHDILQIIPYKNNDLNDDPIYTETRNYPSNEKEEEEMKQKLNKIMLEYE